MKQSSQKTRKKIGNRPVIDSSLQSFYDSLAELIAQEILAEENSSEFNKSPLGRRPI
jgi:hypothetical protein